MRCWPSSLFPWPGLPSPSYSFGAVPLSTQEITGLNYRDDWDRASLSSIREVMAEDFQFAVDNLPLRTSNNSKVSGAVARHYLGELYLAKVMLKKQFQY